MVSKTIDGSSNLSTRAKKDQEKMKLIQYVKDSYRELVDKVTWPTVPQLRNSAIVVMVASLLFAVVIVAMDQSFENIMKAIYGLLYTSAN